MATTYEPIATTTLSSATASITFNSISSTYTDLKIVLIGKFSATNGSVGLQFNSDTGTNYSYTYLYGNGSVASSTRGTSTSQIYTNGNTSSSSTTVPNFVQIDIFSYAGSTYKTVLSDLSYDDNNINSTQPKGLTTGLWRNTSAVTSIKMLCNGTTFDTGTTATLYGIKAA